MTASPLPSAGASDGLSFAAAHPGGCWPYFSEFLGFAAWVFTTLPDWA
jgi:hypothetical protein